MPCDNDSAAMLGIGIEGVRILVDGPRTCYVLGTSSLSASFQRRNLWNLILHLQNPNISDLSLINDLLVYLCQCWLHINMNFSKHSWNGKNRKMNSLCRNIWEYMVEYKCINQVGHPSLGSVYVVVMLGHIFKKKGMHTVADRIKNSHVWPFG